MSISGVGSVGAYSPTQMASQMASRMVKDGDKDQDGSLSKSEFITNLTAHGISQQQAEETFGAIDSEGVGAVNQEQIETYMARMATQGPPQGPPPQGPPPDESAQASSSTSSSASSSSGSYDVMDVNQDGTVSSAEELLYLINHPTESTSADSEGKASGQSGINLTV